MHVDKISVKNFRLLADVDLRLEPGTTVVVGRNNSGKTSLWEVVRRFTAGRKDGFQLEDFSSASYEQFCAALVAFNEGQPEDEVRALLPVIELRASISYDPNVPQYGPLSKFVIDLDMGSDEAVVVAQHALKDGAIAAFFEGAPQGDLGAEGRISYFRLLRERVPSMFGTSLWAEDPQDPLNRKVVELADVQRLLRTGFVNAQRGLDDVTTRETDVLAKILESLFTTASAASASPDDRAIVDALREAVSGIQTQIDDDFATQLKALLPTLEVFGYPGLGGQALETETTLDVGKLLSNHTKVRYAGHGGVALPESYNGLGARNLIFILLQLVGFYRAYRAEPVAPAIHLIFIEEPEAHLHPQMQEVFVAQLSKLAEELNARSPDAAPWPVQFVVSTHSPHIANAAGFECIRYFLATSSNDLTGARRTHVKDLRSDLPGTEEATRRFLHQYLTLTRCDLLFADKAILVEGFSERLLVPVMIGKVQALDNTLPKLDRQYVTLMEVGGAYAHLFFGLLEFLELPFLVVTDIDSVIAEGGAACAVHEGVATSNACIRHWFADTGHTLAELLQKIDADKEQGTRRITYQRPEAAGGSCGRTFEDSFILANGALFGLAEGTAEARATQARELAGRFKKSDFALRFAISETEWLTPSYIADGIRWLARQGLLVVDPALALAQAAAAPAAPEGQAQ